jgi:hypothetical protein
VALVRAIDPQVTPMRGENAAGNALSLPSTTLTDLVKIRRTQPREQRRSEQA